MYARYGRCRQSQREDRYSPYQHGKMAVHTSGTTSNGRRVQLGAGLEIQSTHVYVSSKTRSVANFPNTHKFSQLMGVDGNGIRDLKYVEMKSIEIPNTIYNVNARNNKLYLSEGPGATAASPYNSTFETLYIATVPHGTYSFSTLITTINGLLNGAVPHTAATDDVSGESVNTTNPGNTYEIARDVNTNRCVLRSTDTLPSHYFNLLCPPLSGGTEIEVGSASHSAQMVTVNTKDVHNMTIGSVFDIELKDESGVKKRFSNRTITAKNDAGSAVPTSSVFVFKVGASEWAFTSGDTVTGRVFPLQAQNNLAPMLGFENTTHNTSTSGWNPITITNIELNGTSSIYSTSEPHGYVVGVQGIDMDSMTASSGTTPDGTSDTSIATAPTSTSFTLTVPTDAFVPTLSDAGTGTVRRIGTFRGDKRVDLRGDIVLFVKLLINGHNIGNILNLNNTEHGGSQRYFTKIQLSSDLDETSFKSSLTDTLGSYLLNNPIDKVSSIRVELYNDNNEPADIDNMDWSCELELFAH